MLLHLQGQGQSVPNTSTFNLQDVVNVVGGTSLTGAFINSVDANFDPNYKYNKTSLLNFRNYNGPDRYLEKMFAYSYYNTEYVEQIFSGSLAAAQSALTLAYNGDINGRDNGGFMPWINVKVTGMELGDHVYKNDIPFTATPANDGFYIDYHGVWMISPYYFSIYENKLFRVHDGVLADPNANFDYINITPSYATITAAEQEVFFDIDSNYSSYTISSDQPWCTIILNPGGFSGTASVVVESNRSYETRIATMSIISGGITIAFYILEQSYPY